MEDAPRDPGCMQVRADLLPRPSYRAPEGVPEGGVIEETASLAPPSLPSPLPRPQPCDRNTLPPGKVRLECLLSVLHVSAPLDIQVSKLPIYNFPGFGAPCLELPGFRSCPSGDSDSGLAPWTRMCRRTTRLKRSAVNAQYACVNRRFERLFLCKTDIEFVKLLWTPCLIREIRKGFVN